jgi:putative ABC transport system substrate-binding protein
MQRRKFITLLGGAAVAWPVASRAQQAPMPVVGLLGGMSAAGAAEATLPGLRHGLKEIGFFEGQNVAFEHRYADGRYERLPELAADLVNKQVTVIAAMGENAARAAQAASGGAIPIVFGIGEDPVALGLVGSINRPGGNITGSISIGPTLGPKRVELLHELIPKATSVALLINPKQPREFEAKDVEEKAHAFGWQFRRLAASHESEFDAVFKTLVSEGTGGLIITNDAFFFGAIRRLAALASRHALPAIGPLRAFADAGGLMSYGASIPEVWRNVGIYAGRIIKGAKPSELPVMLPSKWDLVINLRAAKVLSLDVPATLIARADEVIE